MAQIVLDMGSGNTCRNITSRVREMIDAVKAVDTGRHRVVFKWQLFGDMPPNVPLDREVFNFAYDYAKELGYQTTASVFSIDDLLFLGKKQAPFVKIACVPSLYGLVRHVSRGMHVMVSVADLPSYWLVRCGLWTYPLACVREYPASYERYRETFGALLGECVSDHTAGLELWQREQPQIWEKHFVLTRDDPGNPDAGSFAITPEELKEIL